MSLPQLILLLILTIFSAVSVCAKPGLNEENSRSNVVPLGEIRKTNWNDMVPQTLKGSYYNEFWVYHLFFDNDLQIHITFSLADFGSFKSAVSGAKIFVSNFKGNNYHMSREYPIERLVIDESQHIIRLHPERNIHIQGRLPETHRITYQTSKDNVSYLIELELYDIEQGHTWGDGIFRLDGQDMGIFIHIPKAKVRGTVAVNKDTLQVNGTAYMDHSFQTDLSSKLIDKGFRIISHTRSGYEVGYYLIPKKGDLTEVVGFGLKNNYGFVSLNKPEKLSIQSTKDIDGKSVPEQIGVLHQSGHEQTLNRTKDFQHVSFLEELGGLRRRLVRGFLGGEIIEYVGKGKLNTHTPANYNFFIVH